eukprot:g70427.t1
MGQARTFLGAFAGHSDIPVVVFPYDLNYDHVQELSNINNTILVVREHIRSSSVFSPHVAALLALFEIAGMLSSQNLLLLDPSAGWLYSNQVFSFSKFNKVISQEAAVTKIRSKSRVTPQLALRSRISQPSAHKQLADWLEQTVPKCLKPRPYHDFLTPDKCATETNKFIQSWKTTEFSISECLDAFHFGLNVDTTSKKRQAHSCATQHVIRQTPTKLIPASERNNSICIATPTRTKALTEDQWQEEDIFADLFTSIRMTWPAESNIFVRFYVGYESGDSGLDRLEGPSQFSRLFFNGFKGKRADLRLMKIPFTDKDPVYMWNMLFKSAYDDGCEFLWHCVDDIQLKNSIWANEYPFAINNAHNMLPRFGFADLIGFVLG